VEKGRSEQKVKVGARTERKKGFSVSCGSGGVHLEGNRIRGNINLENKKTGEGKGRIEIMEKGERATREKKRKKK